MQAIEFNTQARDGLIKIPSRFKNFENRRVKVILLDQDENPYKEAKVALLEANAIAKEVGLDRMTMEEINMEIAAYRRGK